MKTAVVLCVMYKQQKGFISHPL